MMSYKNLNRLLLVGTIFMLLSSNIYCEADLNDKHTGSILAKAVVFSVNSPIAYVNNKKVCIVKQSLRYSPTLKGKTILVPLEFLSDKLGAKTIWYEQTDTAVITLKDKVAVLSPKSNVMLVNGNELNLSVQPQYIEDKLFVPFDKIAEGIFGKVVTDYNGLIITSEQKVNLTADEVEFLKDKFKEPYSEYLYGSPESDMTHEKERSNVFLTKGNISFEISRNFDFLYILNSLVSEGSSRFNERSNPNLKEAKEHFAGCKDSPFLKELAGLRGGDGRFKEVLYTTMYNLTDFPELKPKGETSLSELKSLLGGEAQVKDFLDKLREIYIKNDGESYFGAVQPKYSEIEKTVMHCFENPDRKESIVLDSIKDYFNTESIIYKDKELKFRLVVSLVRVGGQTYIGSSAFVIYSVQMNSRSFESMVFESIHEFTHGYTSQLNEKYRSRVMELKKFVSAHKGMQHGFYGLNEYTARATTARIIRAAYGEEKYKLQMEREKKSGYVYIEDFCKLFEQYENNREMYDSYNDFLPEVVDLMEKLDNSL